MGRLGGEANYPQFFAFVVISITVTTLVTALVLVTLTPLVAFAVRAIEQGAFVIPSMDIAQILSGFAFLTFWTVFFGGFLAIVGAGLSLSLGYAAWLAGLKMGLPLSVMIFTQIAIAALAIPAAALVYDIPELVDEGREALLIVLLAGLAVGIRVWFHFGRRFYGS
jgi:hypothetical protein